MVSVPPKLPNRRTLDWLHACDQSLADAEQAALALASRGRANAQEITLLRIRIAALRAEIADWRARLIQRGGEVDPQWMQQLSPWCPPPPDLDD